MGPDQEKRNGPKSTNGFEFVVDPNIYVDIHIYIYITDIHPTLGTSSLHMSTPAAIGSPKILAFTEIPTAEPEKRLIAAIRTRFSKMAPLLWGNSEVSTVVWRPPNHKLTQHPKVMIYPLVI